MEAVAPDRSFHACFRSRAYAVCDPHPALGARPSAMVFAASAALTIAAIALIPLGAIGFEFMPAVDRGADLRRRHLSHRNAACKDQRRDRRSFAGVRARIADIQSVTSAAGSEQQGFGGQINLGSAGQIHVFLNLKRKHSTDWWAQQLGAQGQRVAPEAQVVAIPATGTGGGNSQPIDYLVQSSDDDPDTYAPAGTCSARADAGRGARHEFRHEPRAASRRHVRPRTCARARRRHRDRRQRDACDIRRLARDAVRHGQGHQVRASHLSAKRSDERTHDPGDSDPLAHGSAPARRRCCNARRGSGRAVDDAYEPSDGRSRQREPRAGRGALDGAERLHAAPRRRCICRPGSA